jgi:hypothetical protein
MCLAEKRFVLFPRDAATVRSAKAMRTKHAYELSLRGQKDHYSLKSDPAPDQQLIVEAFGAAHDDSPRLVVAGGNAKAAPPFSISVTQSFFSAAKLYSSK